MRTSRMLAGAFVAALVVLPGPVWADATPEGADQIRRDMTAWIERYIRVQQSQGQIRMEGSVQVEPRGDHYTALTPTFLITTERRNVLTIDPIRMDLLPQANGWFDTTVTLPERMVGRTPDGAEDGVFTIGSQNIRGIFAPELQTFTNLDARLDNLAIRSMRDRGEMTISSITAQVESTEGDRGVYDSQIDARVHDLAFFDGRRQRFDIGEIGVAGTVDNIHLQNYVAFVRELQDLLNENATQQRPGQPTPEFFNRLSALLQRTPPLLNGMEVTYSFDNLRVVEGDNRVELGGGSFGIRLEGLEGTTSTLGLETTVGAIGIVPPPPFAQFIPNDSVINVQITGLPNQQLLGIVQTFLQSSATMGPDRAGQMAVLQLQQAIMTGGARVEITEIRFATDRTRLHLHGTIVPEPRSQTGITANATMDVAGLPELIADLQSVPNSQQAVQVLTALQAVGTQATADDGTAIRRYDFVLGPQGAPTLNGTDMTPLLAPLSGPQRGPGRTPPANPQRP